MPAIPRASPSLHHGGAVLWTTRLDRRSPVSLSRQLAAALHRAISDGSIPAGARLPSTRALAAELGVARSTVVAVFEQLTAEGFIAARPGSGYFVPEALIEIDDRARGNAGVGAGASRPISRQAGLLAGP